MSSQSGQSEALLEAIKSRAELYAQIRRFFARRSVLEVDTAVLSEAATTDPHIESLAIASPPLYLQTSPEFAMKKLLVAGSGSIYQIAKAFRQGESGKRHRPEFTMLEWYRVGMDYHGLMDEVAELWQLLVAERPVQKITYRELFQQHFALDPHSANPVELARLVREHVTFDATGEDRDTLLDLLMSHVIEPTLGRDNLTFVYDYPATQCALAAIVQDREGQAVAQRFELYVDAIELANGYQELTDWQEQERRFLSDNCKRKVLGRSELPIDHQLVAALKEGLPQCSGVALGVERLLMLKLGVEDIAEVLAH